METFGYRNLIAYQKAKEVVKQTYRLIKKFPDCKKLIHYKLFQLTINYKLYTINYKLYTINYKLYTINYTLYTKLCTINFFN